MFRLITFPFRLVKKILWLIIWHSVYFFLCRPYLLIIALLALGGGGWYMASQYDGDMFENNTTGTVPLLTALPALTHQPVDGNSRFAKNLLKGLDDYSYQFYAQHYQYAMMYGTDKEPYLWQGNQQFFGKITPQPAFVSAGGHRCRRFTELLHTPSGAQNRAGLGCERSDGAGWCRLPHRATPNCNISMAPNTMWDNVKRWF